MKNKLIFYGLYPAVWFYAPMFKRMRVMVVCGQEFLAIKNKFGDNKWHLPGGGQKRGETNKQTAVREVREELGLNLREQDLKVLLPYGIYQSQGLFYRSETYIVRLASRPKLEPNHEIRDIAWLPIKGNVQRIGKIVAEALKRV